MNYSFCFGSRSQNSVEKSCFSQELSDSLFFARSKPGISGIWKRLGIGPIFEHKASLHFAGFLLLFLSILLPSGLVGAESAEGDKSGISEFSEGPAVGDLGFENTSYALISKAEDRKVPISSIKIPFRENPDNAVNKVNMGFGIAENFLTFPDCITPPDQDFGTYEDLIYGSSATYQCIVYSSSTGEVGIGDAAGEAITLSPLFSGSAVVMYSGSLGGGFASFASISPSDNFKIVSFVADFYGHSNGNNSESYSIKGYNDGDEIVSVEGFGVKSSGTYGVGDAAIVYLREDYNENGSNSGTLTFGTAWSNIDEVRFFPEESAPYNNFFIGLDNIDFEPAVVPASAPKVTSNAVSGITSSSATLNGSVTSDGGASVTARGFVYSASDDTPTIGEDGVTNVSDGSGTGTFEEIVSGLTASTTYYYQAYATNSEGTSYGGVESFITEANSGVIGLNAGDMVVLGIDAVNDRVTFATMVDIPTGTVIKITDKGWDQATNAFTTSSTGDGIVTWTPTSSISAGTVLTLTLGGSDNSPANSLINITAGSANLTNEINITTYTVTDAITIGGEQLFIYQGDDNNPYFIFGLNASRNTNLDASFWQTTITAALTESMLPNGNGSQNALTNGVNALGILTNPSGANAAAQQFDNVAYTGPITATDKNGWLTRITDKNNWDGDDTGVMVPSVGITSGSKLNLSGSIRVPNVTTSEASSITASSTTLSGNITDDGGASIIARGFVYSSSDNTPTIGESGVTQVAVGSGTGIFSEVIGGLSPSTTYYYQAYATNSEGTSYGEVKSFATLIGAFITEDDIPANNFGPFTKNLEGADFNFSPATNNYIDIQENSGFLGLYVLDYDIFDGNGTTLTIDAPGYSFDLGDFKYFVSNGETIELAITLTFINGSTNTNTYNLVGDGLYKLFTTYSTSADDILSIKLVGNGFLTYNDFEITDIKPLPTNPILTASDAATCSGSSVALTATGTGTIKWYDAATGGNLLFEGVTFVTPALFSNTTYYLEDDTFSGTRTPVTVSMLFGSICGSVIDNVLTLKLPSGGTTISDLHSSLSGNTLTLTVSNSQNSLVLASDVSGISTDGTSSITVDLAQFSTFAGLSVLGNSGTDLVTIGAGGLDFSTVPGAADQLISLNLSSATDQLTIANTIKTKGTGDIYIQSGLGFDIGATLTTLDTLTIHSSGTVTQSSSVSSKTLMLGKTGNTGTYTLTNSSNSAVDLRAVATGSISYTDADGIIVRNATTAGDVTISAGGNISVENTGIQMNSGSGSVELTNSSGTITIKGNGIRTKGNVTVTSVGAISSFSKAIDNTAGTGFISLMSSAGGVTSGGNGLQSKGAIMISAAGNIAFSGTETTNKNGSGDISLITTSGTIDLGGDGMTSKGNMILTAPGKITISSSGIDNTLGFGNISITSTDNEVAISGQGVNSRGELNVQSKGKITSSGSSVRNSGGTGKLQLISSESSITTSGSGIVSRGEIFISAAGNIALNDGSTANSLGSGDIKIITSSGSINTGSGGVSSKGKVILSATGDIIIRDYGVNNILGTDLIDVKTTAGQITINGSGIESKGSVTLNAFGLISVSAGGVDNTYGTGQDILATSTAGKIELTGAGFKSKGNVYVEANEGVDINRGGIQNHYGTGDISIKSVTSQVSVFDCLNCSDADYGLKSTGTITLEADAVSLTGPVNANASAVYLKPASNNMTIDLGGTDAADILGISETELGWITANEIVIGDAINTTEIVVNNALSTDSNLTLKTVASTGELNLKESLSVKVADISGSSIFSTSIVPSTIAFKLIVSEFVNLGSETELRLNSVASGLVQGSKLILIDNNGCDLVSGTFKDLAEGDVFEVQDTESNTIFFKISYVGGDGNDLELQVFNPMPVVTDENISISGATGMGGVYKIGDTVTASWNNTAEGDNNSEVISSVTVDFSQFGGGSAVVATNTGGIWTASYTLTAGEIDTSNLNVSVTATSSLSTKTTTADTSNATVDIVAPIVSGFSPVNNATVVSLQPTLIITFDDEVILGSTGIFSLKKAEDDGCTITSILEFDLSDPYERSLFILSEDKLTVSLTIAENLPVNTQVILEIPTGFVKDLVGNSFVGFSDYTYTWSFTTINKLDQTITFPEIEAKTYGDLTFTLGNAETDRGLTVTYTATDPTVVSIKGNQATILKSGSTTITATQDGDETNFAASPVDQTLTVGKKELTITVDSNQSKVYGASDPTLTYKATGFEGDDDVTILTGSLARAAGEAVDDYKITQGTLSAGNNYTIDFTGADFAITAKTLTITVDANQSKVYGAGDPTFTYQATGFEGDDDVTILTGSLARAAGEAVGDYKITQGCLSAGDNYEINFVGVDFAITKARLTVTAGDKTKVYGQQDPEFTVSYKGFVLEEDESDLDGNLDFERESGENVGIYEITLDGYLSDNYEISYVSGELEVTKAAVTITAADKSKTYGLANPSLTFSYSGLVNGDTKVSTEPSISTTATQSSNVGSYQITLSGAADQNYAITLINGTLTIGKKDLTITADNKQKVYGEANPTLTFSYTGLVNGDTKVTTEPSISTTATQSSNVGSYPITLSGAADQNYAITLVNGTLTIGKKDLTITADNKSKTYGEANPTLTFSYTGLVNGDTKVSMLPSISTTATSSSNVGTYPITLNGGSDENYTITLVNGTLVIGKAALTITADNKSKTYGEANPTLTFSYTGLVNGDSKVITLPSIATTAVVSSNVGTYPITLTGGSDENYAITLVNGTLTIGKKDLTITADNKQKVYGEANPTLTFSYTGLVNGDTKVTTEPSISTTATQSSNVGSYPITLSGAADQNYAITLVNGTLTIGKKDLTITADNKQKVYGEANPTLTFSYTGLVNGDTKVTTEPSISTTATQSSNVGSYPITLSGAADQNYAITLINGTLTIGKKDLTITADNKQKVYGETNPTLTFSYTGLVNGDTKVATEPSISTTATQSSNVGSYPITLSGAADQNYAITLVNGTLTIGKKDLTITADNQQKVYGEANPTLTFSYAGLVNGDTKVATEPSISTTATAASNVGTYPITLTGGSDENYTITLVDGTLTIGKKDLKITADDKSKIYGEENPALTFTYTGLVNGDTEVATEPSLSTLATAASSVGIYPITLTGGEDQNYAITLVAGEMEIVPAVLQVKVERKTKIFGQSDPVFTYVVSGLVDTDEIGEVLTGELEREEGEIPGLYEIRQGTLKTNGNYVIAFAGGTLLIEAARILSVTELGVIETAWGQEPVLPSNVTILTTDGQLFDLGVIWNTFGLDIFKRGVYTIRGTFNLPVGIVNPDELIISVAIRVIAKPAPLDVMLSNSVFVGEETNFFITVGAFQVNDPVDNIHEVVLLGPGYDNAYFEIKDNILFWSSADRAEGKTTFTIIVRVTDRDGNTLDKFFEVSRIRQDINEIEVFNTFTPNGDGINDKWGVPEIRFFSGARVQVFDRSGERVFYTEDPDVSWDGTFKGIELPVGTYYWVLELRETGETRKGLLNLLRK
jgi:gliding motility-associated-like protein